MFIINCKNYEEVSGDKIIKFVKTAEKISKKFKIKIAICPPQHLIGVVSNSSIPILAQHIDDSKIGSTTGFVIPELLKKSKVKGSLINHSEHRISSKEIKKLVEKLKVNGFEDAFIFKHTAGSKTLYLVRVGKVTRSETKKLAAMSKKLNYIEYVQVTSFSTVSNLRFQNFPSDFLTGTSESV